MPEVLTLATTPGLGTAISWLHVLVSAMRRELQAHSETGIPDDSERWHPVPLAKWGTLTSRLLPVALSTLPQIDRLVLATVTTVPEWHPQHDTFEPFPVHAWLIRHPDGAILVDTGVGVGNQVIDEWYHPRCTSLLDALAGVGVAPSDISAVVMSHLHFDHCGQPGGAGSSCLRAGHRVRGSPDTRLHGAGLVGYPQ